MRRPSKLTPPYGKVFPDIMTERWPINPKGNELAPCRRAGGQIPVNSLRLTTATRKSWRICAREMFYIGTIGGPDVPDARQMSFRRAANGRTCRPSARKGASESENVFLAYYKVLCKFWAKHQNMRSNFDDKSIQKPGHSHFMCLWYRRLIISITSI